LAEAFAQNLAWSNSSALMSRASAAQSPSAPQVDTSRLRLARTQIAAAGDDDEVILAAAAAAVSNTDEVVSGRHPWGGTLSIPQEYGLFVAGDVGFGEIESANGLVDIGDRFITAGVDRQFNDTSLLGVAVTFADFDADASIAKADAMGLGVSSYGSVYGENAYLNGYVSYSWFDFESARPIILGPTILTADGQTNGTELQAGLETAYMLRDEDGLEIGPIARLRHASVDIDGYTETGAGPFGSIVDARDFQQTVVGAGVQASVSSDSIGDVFTVFGRATVEADLQSDDLLGSAALIGAPTTSFAVIGAPEDDEFFGNLMLGLSSLFNEALAVQTSVETNIGRNGVEETRVSGAVKMGF
jgi:outer membrane autotransporter protein